MIKINKDQAEHYIWGNGCDGKVVTLKPLDGVQSSLHPASDRNESQEDVEFLVISTPSTQGDRTAL